LDKYLIYALVDPVDNNIKYIGRSSNGISRPKWHLASHTYETSHLRVHRWIKGIVSKGLTPSIQILESWDQISSKDLSLAEIKWINVYKPLGRLHNLTDGGDGTSGRTISEKHRKRIIESNHTRKISIDTIQKMSDSAKKRSKHKPKKIVVLSDGREYVGLSAAAIALGCSASHVSLMIKHRLCYDGYTASFK